MSVAPVTTTRPAETRDADRIVEMVAGEGWIIPIKLMVTDALEHGIVKVTTDADDQILSEWGVDFSYLILNKPTAILQRLFLRIRHLHLDSNLIEYDWRYLYLYSNLIEYDWSIQIDDFAQDCSNSIVNALELPQSCTKPSIFFLLFISWFSQQWKCDHILIYCPLRVSDDICTASWRCHGAPFTNMD